MFLQWKNLENLRFLTKYKKFDDVLHFQPRKQSFENLPKYFEILGDMARLKN